MNRKTVSIFLAVLLLFAVVISVPLRKQSESDAAFRDSDPEIPQVRIEKAPNGEIVTAAGTEEIAQFYRATDTDPEDDIQILQQVLYTYRQATGANPEGGENGAISDRLFGKNKMGVRFLPDRPEWVNRDGELIDRWGTPYFFHSVSPEDMEIVSAGPDKELWTDDDVSLQ